MQGMVEMKWCCMTSSVQIKKATQKLEHINMCLDVLKLDLFVEEHLVIKVQGWFTEFFKTVLTQSTI